MANWYGHARSNYFKVKDADKFKEAMDELNGLTLHESEGNVFCIIIDGENDGAFPSHKDVVDEKGLEDQASIGIAQEIAPHLADEEVAIFMEVGAEKQRYVTGWAWAINSKGEDKYIELSQIYEQAKELGSNITKAEY